MVISKTIILGILLIQSLIQQPIKNELIRDLLCLFIKDVHQVSETGIISYKSTSEGKNTILDICVKPFSSSYKQEVAVDSSISYGILDEEITLDDSFSVAGDDYPSWQIVFKDRAFNPFLSHKYDGSIDSISDIEHVVKSHDIETIDDAWLDSYCFTELDTYPIYVEGDENTVLSRIVQSVFNEEDRKYLEMELIPFIAVIIIDKEGIAHFESFSMELDNDSLKHKAKEVIDQFCEKRFIPGRLRGKNVNCKIGFPVGTNRQFLPSK